jgi:hypothetical protein
MQVKQSSAVAHFLFLMVDSIDHVTGKTGLTPTVTISKNAAAFASPAGAVTEVSGGWYKLAANATDSNTLGVLALHATGTGADPTDMILANIVAYDPQAAGVTVTTNNDKTGYALTSGERTATADAILDRNLGTGTDSGGRTVRNALRPNVNKVSVPLGIVYKEDDSTTAFTFTTTTDGSALPITVVDPA